MAFMENNRIPGFPCSLINGFRIGKGQTNPKGLLKEVDDRLNQSGVEKINVVPRKPGPNNTLFH